MRAYAMISIVPSGTGDVCRNAAPGRGRKRLQGFAARPSQTAERHISAEVVPMLSGGGLLLMSHHWDTGTIGALRFGRAGG